jgi:hypothetical protein
VFGIRTPTPAYNIHYFLPSELSSHGQGENIVNDTQIQLLNRTNLGQILFILPGLIKKKEMLTSVLGHCLRRQI